MKVTYFVQISVQSDNLVYNVRENLIQKQSFKGNEVALLDHYIEIYRLIINKWWDPS